MQTTAQTHATPAAAADPLADPTWVSAVNLSRSGANAQALPLLEQLVSAAPGNKSYRFQLALVLYRMSRDVRAKYHLEQLLGTSLTVSERGVVDRMIATIDARKLWSAYFSFRVLPESNGTKQTEERELVVGELPLTLDDTAIGKPTVSAVAIAGISYAPTLRPGLKAQLSLNTYLKHSAETALRDYQIVGRAGLSYSPDPLRYWDGGISLGTRHAGGDPYSDTVGIYANHARRVGEAGILRMGVDVSRAFRRYGRADIDRNYLSLSYSHAINGNASLTFSSFAEFNRSDQRTQDGIRRGISVGGSYTFKGGLTAGLTLSGESDRRSGVSQLFGVARSDDKIGIDLRIHHNDFRIGSFAPQLQLGFERNRSNIPLADYINRSVSIGFTRQF